MKSICATAGMHFDEIALVVCKAFLIIYVYYTKYVMGNVSWQHILSNLLTCGT